MYPGAGVWSPERTDARAAGCLSILAISSETGLFTLACARFSARRFRATLKTPAAPRCWWARRSSTNTSTARRSASRAKSRARGATRRRRSSPAELAAANQAAAFCDHGNADAGDPDSHEDFIREKLNRRSTPSSGARPPTILKACGRAVSFQKLLKST